MAELLSAYDHESEDTYRGMNQYASSMGMSMEEFDALLAGRLVLDLGSGCGGLAIESAYRQKTEPGYSAPKRIDSLNIRYSAPDYPQMWQDETRGRLDKILATKKGRAAVEEAKQSFIALDWNELDALEDKYDLIVSSFGFPLYSDFKISTPEADYDMEKMHRGEWDTLTFGPQSRKVFSKAINRLNDDGIILLQTDWPFLAWTYARAGFHQEFQRFFQERGCSLAMENANGKIVMKIWKAQQAATEGLAAAA